MPPQFSPLSSLSSGGHKVEEPGGSSRSQVRASMCLDASSDTFHSTCRLTLGGAGPLLTARIDRSRETNAPSKLACFPPQGGSVVRSFSAHVEGAPPLLQKYDWLLRAPSVSTEDLTGCPLPLLRPRVARAGDHSCLLGHDYTVKCCFTISALNSSLLPAATTAPLAITTYFSASRAAKWSPCSTNKMANRLEFLKPMITSSI